MSLCDVPIVSRRVKKEGFNKKSLFAGCKRILYFQFNFVCFLLEEGCNSKILSFVKSL